jgi:hypothetical protein
VGRPKLIICRPKLIMQSKIIYYVVQNYLLCRPKLIYEKKSDSSDEDDLELV